MSRDEAEQIETARLCINIALETAKAAAMIYRAAGMPLANVVQTLAAYMEQVEQMSQPEFRAAREAIARR